MNCRDARDRLFAERSGELSEPLRGELASHLAECPTCRRIRADLTVGLETAEAELARTRVPDADIEWAKVRRALRQGSKPRRWTAGWFALPAAMAAAAAVGVYLRTEPTPQSAPPATVAVAEAHPTTSLPSAAAAAPVDGATPTSTVVYVDDRSGWTFVWDAGADAGGTHI